MPELMPRLFIWIYSQSQGMQKTALIVTYTSTLQEEPESNHKYLYRSCGQLSRVDRCEVLPKIDKTVTNVMQSK